MLVVFKSESKRKVQIEGIVYSLYDIPRDKFASQSIYDTFETRDIAIDKTHPSRTRSAY